MTYSNRAIVARIHEQLDHAWNKEYVKFLDFRGREPHRRAVVHSHFCVLRSELGLRDVAGAVANDPGHRHCSDCEFRFFALQWL